MGIDGGEYSRGGKRGVGFGGHVCRAGFLCETALGDFRFGDAIENGPRQSRAPLRAVARTRAPAERPVSLDDRITDCLPCRLACLAEITGGGSRQCCEWRPRFYSSSSLFPVIWPIVFDVQTLRSFFCTSDA